MSEELRARGRFEGGVWKLGADGQLETVVAPKWIPEPPTFSFASSAAGQREGCNVPEDLRKMSYYASDGPWESDSEWNADGAYGGGPDHGTGYDDFIIVDAEGRSLMGTENSIAKQIEEEYDEDGGTAWDQVGKRNTAFAVAAVNFVRSLIASPSALEERRDEVERLRDRLRRKIMNSRLNDGYVPAYLAGWNAALDLLDAALTPVPGER